MSRIEQYLIEALFEAHHESCFRPNVSTVTVANVASGSNDMGKALATAMLTAGGKHAPLEQTYDFLNLDQPSEAVAPLLMANKRVPGWGNSFIKDGPDPLWVTVDNALQECYTQLHNDLSAVTAELHKRDKKLYPNPSAYTAAVGIALGVPRKALVCLFISARLDAWSSIAYNQLEK